MRVNGYRCDGCSKEHLIAEYQFPAHYAEFVPVNWFVVFPGGESNKCEPWLFCSKGCLRDWLTERLTANDISLKQEEPKGENADILSEVEVVSVLNRLNRYYYGRMRAARKAVVESRDSQSSFQYALSASQWEAKRDAVLKVAENLDITLKEHEE